MAGHLEKHISAVERKVQELERRLSVNAFESQKKIDEFSKFQERTKGNFLDIEKKFANIEEMPSTPSVPPRGMEKAHQRLEQEMKSMDSSADHKAMEERLSSMSAEDARSHKAMEERLSSMNAEGARSHQGMEENLDDRLRSIEDLLMLLEVEVVKSKDHGMVPGSEMLHQGVPKEFEDKLDTLEGKMERIEKSKLKMPVERLDIDDRLKSIEDNFLSLEARTKEEVSKMDSMVSGKAMTEEAAGHFVDKIHDRMEELRRSVDKAHLIKTEIVNREKDFAKKSDFDTFQDFVTQEISKLRQVVDRVAAVERSIDTHLIDIEERVRGEVQKHTQEWKADIATHRRDQDLSIIKTEEKILTSLSDEVKRIEQTMGSQRAEIESLIKVERKQERELEARATRIVTKELAEFSSLMDKRFPHMVQKGDFDKFSDEMVSRVAKVEAPDTGPIMARLTEMDKRLEQFNTVIIQIAQRMPLVME